MELKTLFLILTLLISACGKLPATVNITTTNPNGGGGQNGQAIGTVIPVPSSDSNQITAIETPTPTPSETPEVSSTPSPSLTPTPIPTAVPTFSYKITDSFGVCQALKAWNPSQSTIQVSDTQGDVYTFSAGDSEFSDSYGYRVYSTFTLVESNLSNQLVCTITVQNGNLVSVK